MSSVRSAQTSTRRPARRPAPRIYLHSLKTCLRGLAFPAIGVMGLCFLGLYSQPSQVGTGVDRAAGYWLHLPGMLLVASGLAATLESWPLYSRERPGFGWLLRVKSGELHGCLPAALGGLTAIGLALAVCGLAFSALLSALGFDLGVAHHPAEMRAVEARPYLDEHQPSLSFDCRDEAPLTELRLTPKIWYSKAGDLPRLRVLADGEPISDWRASVGDLLQVRISPPRRIQRITVERETTQSMVVYLPVDAIEADTDAVRSGYLNCMLASLSFLTPALLALAAMVLGHAHLNLAVNLSVGLFVGLITALLDLTPSHAAVTAFARSRYIEVADLGLPLLYAGLVSGLVLLLRMLLPRAVASRASVRDGAAVHGAEPVLGRMDDDRSST